MNPRNLVTFAILLLAALPLQAGVALDDGVIIMNQEVGKDGSSESSATQSATAAPPDSGGYVVKPGDCLWTIAERLLGSPYRWQELFEANRSIISNPNLIYPGQRLALPGAAQTKPSSSNSSADDSAPSTGKQGFNACLPLAHGHVSSNFGWRTHPIHGDRRHHDGIDIGCPHATTLRATGDGTVIFAGWSNGYGNVVKIRHPDGTETRYAHCKDFNVHSGQSVTAGQAIARVNSTGLSTGDHLHFEVVRNGSKVDPRNYFDFPAQGSSF